MDPFYVDPAGTDVSWRDNPHRPGTAEHRCWQLDWSYAHQATGTAGYARAKVEVDARIAEVAASLPQPSAATIAADAVYDEVVDARRPQYATGGIVRGPTIIYDEAYAYVNGSRLGPVRSLVIHYPTPAPPVDPPVSTREFSIAFTADVDALAKVWEKVHRAAIAYPPFLLYDDPDAPPTISGTPTRSTQARLCPTHGEPAGRCRACWRR